MAFVKTLITGGPKVERAAIADPLKNGDLDSAGQTVNQGIDQQQQFVKALNGQNGLGNQRQVFAQQQALANQLQNQANGVGPNVAQNQLNQATGQNIAAQNALMAGQRGASANVGLLAREAAQQGANTQQQAVGQSATLQAQQQIAEQQALAQQQAQMAQLAGSQVAQQASGIQGLNQFAQGAQSNALNNVSAANNAQLGATSALNTANAAKTGQQMQLIGGLATAGSSLAAAAHGGMVESGPKSMAAIHLLGKSKDYKQGGVIPGKAAVKGDSYANDKVPVITSPGEIILPRHVTQGKDPPKAAAEFVRQVMMQKKRKLA